MPLKNGQRILSGRRRALCVVLVVALVAACLPIAACDPRVTPFSKPYSFDEMQQMLRDDGDVDVAFDQVGAETTEKFPQEVVYTCSAEGRDLQFHCTSGVYPDAFFCVILGWFRWVKTDYKDTILELYREQANEAAQQIYAESPEGRYGDYFIIHRRSEIPQVVAAMHAMDDIYAQEAQYHDGAWLDEPRKVFIYLEEPSADENDPDRIDVVSEGVRLDGINGVQFDEEGVIAQVQAEYQSYEDGTDINYTAKENYGLSIEETQQYFTQADN